MANRLIITNGDVAVARCKEAGIDADFLPWRDALHDGPVPDGLLLEALSIVRAQFLAATFGSKLSEVGWQFTQRDAAVRNHGQYEQVELWFEHDLYDQLQLIQLIDFFATERRRDGLLLVQSDDYLGTLPLEALSALAAKAQPMEARAFEAGRRGWAALTAPTPEKLAALAAVDSPALPYLAPALRRLLRELPAVASGLSLTEEKILTVLAPGLRAVGDLFAATQKQETARFLGDASFFLRLDSLVFAPQPLISGLEFPSSRCGGADTPEYRAYAATRVRLTEKGRLALARRFDHAQENAIDRWFGGTHVTAKNMWRRDQDGRLALAPGAVTTAR